MCTYTTEQRVVSGSGKGPARWVAVDRATVYYDHPVHAQAGHTLNIDLTPAEGAPGDRVALELTADAALDLADAIVAALAAVPADLTGIDPGRLGVPGATTAGSGRRGEAHATRA